MKRKNYRRKEKRQWEGKEKLQKKEYEKVGQMEIFRKIALEEKKRWKEKLWQKREKNHRREEKKDDVNEGQT